MSFQERHARLNRLYQENAAWKLLRAKNAPLILAFLNDLFEDSSDVAFGPARIALDAELAQCRELGLWETDSNAMNYLREWIQAGWLREIDDLLSKTDACELALRYCQRLDQRENAATATHLRIVQEAVRDFTLAISPDAKGRIRLLQARQAELQLEIDALAAGVVVILNDVEKKEHIKEIYQLASVLTGDFRRVEDEIREMDQKLRVDMIQSNQSRGEILLGILEKEHLLANTDAGRAFEGFFQLLCDQNRSMEFREQLRSILEQPAARHLNPMQHRFLGKLMRELSKESERVFQVRRRTEENLRAYIESGAHTEIKAIDQLLGTLEQYAILFREAGISPRTALNIRLVSGAVKISSIENMKLRFPEEPLDTSGIEEHKNSGIPSEAMLDSLSTVKIMSIAENIKSVLLEKGPLSIAGISRSQPIEAGLEELVAYLRVAKAVGAAELDENETLEIRDKQGHRIKATVPLILLHAEQFPTRMEDLDL